MNLRCSWEIHKPVATNPERGVLIGGTHCKRCGSILTNPIEWPNPLPSQTIQPFCENSKCPICHSSPIYTYFCLGIRWDLETKYPYYIPNENLKCPYGEKGHLHRSCSCKYKWVEKTAIDAELTEGE